jgi:hypothetical protein
MYRSRRMIRPVGYAHLTGQPLLGQRRRLCLRGHFKAVRKSGNDDYDKFSLPTGSGFTENTLELSARRFVTDVKLGRSGPQCFSYDEMKRQSGLRWRQPKVTM